MAYNLSGHLYIKHGIGHIFVKISLFIVQKIKKITPYSLNRTQKSKTSKQIFINNQKL